MKSSIFIFGTDLLHEGYETVIDTLKEQGTVGGMALSATYHNARDVFPHNPKHRIYRHEGDIAWFKPEKERYVSGLVPKMAIAAEGEDVLLKLCDLGERQGMPVSAWTIFLHNARLATANPECATRNIYGDPYLTDLCPANPRVRAFCRELATDISRYPVQRLMAEALHYKTLEHGEHHERYLINLPQGARTILSLCFCPHCSSIGKKAGVAIEKLTSTLRLALAPIWAGSSLDEDVEPLITDEFIGELDKFEKVRESVVTSLVAEVREAMSPTKVELSYIDHTGAMSQILPGADITNDVAMISRKLGIAPGAISAQCDEFSILGYVDTAERLEAQLDYYKSLVREYAKISVVLRPLIPDCHDEDNFNAKMATVHNSGVSRVEFYHYAMMPLDRLDWIRRALDVSEKQSFSKYL